MGEIVHLPVHARTGLAAIGWGKRGPIWPVMGAAEPATPPATPPEPTPAPVPPPADPATPPAPQQPDDKGFPANTPLAQMTLEQQVAYWRHHSRKHEDRVNQMSDYEELKGKAGELDKLVEASRNEHEVALDEARKAARAEAFGEVAGKLAEAHIRTAAAGRIPGEQLDALLQPIDPKHFLNQDGVVDADKVTAWVNQIAPAGTNGTPKPPDMGQGQHGGTPQPSVAAGAALYAERHPNKT